jgi:hypothetical protein
MSEAELQEAIEGALAVGGWLFHHDLPATRIFTGTHGSGMSGFPDIVALNPERGEVLVLELKSDRGRVEPLQAEWLDAFQACGIPARVVRPGDLDQLVRELVGDRLLSVSGG